MAYTYTTAISADAATCVTIKASDYNKHDYDELLITTVEKDNKKIMAYNVAGIKIKGEKVFDNKSKTMMLNFYGESEVLDRKLTFDKILTIDTDIYNKYDWYVNGGILYVILFEKINKEPEFNRVEKSKKAAKEEVNE